VRIDTSFDLIDRIPDDCVAVSESGIRTAADLARLRVAGFDAFLVGTSLMLATDPAAALSELVVAQPQGS
jgi:indole-3-glycerol phosphate synthase